MIETASSKRRVILYPIVVLVAIVLVTAFSGRRTPVPPASLEALVTRWCETAARGGDVQAMLGAADPFLSERAAAALVEACGPLRDAPSLLSVTVAPGFGPDPGVTLEGREASHHAVVWIGAARRLGLRFVQVDGQIVLVGYWVPDPVDAHADGPTSAIRSRER